MPTAGDEFYDARTHARNTLFCGTRVVQTRNYARQRTLAVVVRTGFLTTKGRLVLSIMYPAPVDFKFEQDSYKFVGFLAAIAFTGKEFYISLHRWLKVLGKFGLGNGNPSQAQKDFRT